MNVWDTVLKVLYKWIGQKRCFILNGQQEIMRKAQILASDRHEFGHISNPFYLTLINHLLSLSFYFHLCKMKVLTHFSRVVMKIKCHNVYTMPNRQQMPNRCLLSPLLPSLYAFLGSMYGAQLHLENLILTHYIALCSVIYHG